MSSQVLYTECYICSILDDRRDFPFSYKQGNNDTVDYQKLEGGTGFAIAGSGDTTGILRLI